MLEVPNKCHYRANMHYILMIFLSSLLDLSLVLAEQGSECTLNIEEEEGICKIITDCPYAQDLLRKKIYPKTCGFIGKIPIVCCKSKPTQNLSLVTETSTSTNSTSTDGGYPGLAPQNFANLSREYFGDLSKNKCLNYYPKPMYPIFVTGGKPSLAKEFPHMAIIGYGAKDNIQWQCAGSLISKSFVVTAAHCITSKLGEAKYVRLGDLDLSTEEDDADPQDFTIIRRVPHPSFKPPVRYHDIALLELDREVALSAYVSPACLNTERYLNQSILTATGWGQTRFGGNYSSFMMKVDLDPISKDNCSRLFGKISNTLLSNGIVEDLQICAGGIIGQDTCQGDSGGPLQVKLADRTFTVNVHSLIGVTSFGKACGLSKAPGIYTRVSNYIPWIESIAFEKEPIYYGFRPLN